MVGVTVVDGHIAGQFHWRGAVHPEGDAGAVKRRLTDKGSGNLRERRERIQEQGRLVGGVAEEETAEEETMKKSL